MFLVSGQYFEKANKLVHGGKSDVHKLKDEYNAKEKKKMHFHPRQKTKRGKQATRGLWDHKG